MSWLTDYRRYTRHAPGCDIWHRWAGAATLAAALGTRLRILPYGPVMYSPLSVGIVGRDPSRIAVIRIARDIAEAAGVTVLDGLGPPRPRGWLCLPDLLAWIQSPNYRAWRPRLPEWLTHGGLSILCATSPVRLRQCQEDYVAADWILKQGVWVATPFEARMLPSGLSLSLQLRHSLVERLKAVTRSLPKVHYARVTREALAASTNPDTLRLAWIMAADSGSRQVRPEHTAKAEECLAEVAGHKDLLQVQDDWEALISRLLAMAKRNGFISGTHLSRLRQRHGKQKIDHALAVLQGRGHILRHPPKGKRGYRWQFISS